MSAQLTLIHLPSGACLANDEDRRHFVLKTCLRTIVLDLSYPDGLFSTTPILGFSQEIFYDQEAYCVLLEIICGLRSRILGETEIVQQFKDAFEQYLRKKSRHPLLTKILQKCLQDSKLVRSEYLRGISQKSYAILAKKLLLHHRSSQHEQNLPSLQDLKDRPPVLLIGSGKLAVDVIHQLRKFYPLQLTARNEEKMFQLCDHHQLESLPWASTPLWLSYRTIICCVGSDEHVLFEEDFFQTWKSLHKTQSLFIDFGSPSTIRTTYSTQDGVYKLKDLFLLEQQYDQLHREKIELAKDCIQDLAKKYFLKSDQRVRSFHDYSYQSTLPAFTMPQQKLQTHLPKQKIRIMS